MWAGCLPRSAAVQPGSALLVAGEGAGARAWNDVGTRTEISPRAMHEEPKVKAQAARPEVNAATEERKEALMDAKYNRLIDSVAVRLTLNMALSNLDCRVRRSARTCCQVVARGGSPIQPDFAWMGREVAANAVKLLFKTNYRHNQ